MLRLFLPFFLFLFLLNFSALAQTSGCYVSSPASFAVVSVGSAGPSPTTLRPTYTGSLALNTTTTCPRVKSFSNNRGANTCYIRTGSSPNYTYTSGMLYDYERENCPLDDYIGFMVLAVGGVAFAMLRRYQTA